MTELQRIIQILEQNNISYTYNDFIENKAMLYIGMFDKEGNLNK